jgi:Flp pilus assembly protein TadB
MTELRNILLALSMVCFISTVVVAIIFTLGFSWIWEYALMILGGVALVVLYMVLRDRREKNETEKYGK